MKDPKVYLAIDNCFASKRWTKPTEWMELIKELGIYYIEASADNECDPLYSSKGYLKDWVSEIIDYSKKTGINIANLYSGHGTYSTLGLSHTDSRNQDKIQNEWLKPMASIASELNAGFGFYCHAFPKSILENPAVYSETLEELYRRLAKIAGYCREIGLNTPGVEQMYTPHQVPWTIEGSLELLEEVVRISSSPFYLTIDTGHMSGQRKFLLPSKVDIQQAVQNVREGLKLSNFWLGPQSAYVLFNDMIHQPISKEDYYLEKIQLEMKKYPYLFSKAIDGDPYAWLKKLGCYSPIIHLQQTDGTTSSHQPFSKEFNENGIIFGEKLLPALLESYKNNSLNNMPPKCDSIYLTLEIFSGTSELPIDIINKIKESVAYWRKFIPEDGMKLSEAVNLLE